MKRPSFSDAFIRDRILAPGALEGLDDQAAAIFKVMVNTGARPSEIAALRRDRIILTGDVPHIQIRPDDRQLKSRRAARDIPLCGVSLEAMRAFPAGFDRYAQNSASLSGVVNSFLRSRGLTETRADDGKETTMYSMRHNVK